MHNIEKLYDLEKKYGKNCMWLFPQIGFRYGYLIVINKPQLIYNPETKKSISHTLCKCINCNNEKQIKTGYLVNGSVHSCGRRECRFNSVGGFSHKKLYGIWRGMINRCENVNNQNYKYYGGKGIKICQKWRENFIVFKQWADSHGYKEGLSIDRIDPNQDYYPENCEWVTRSENSKRVTSSRDTIIKQQKEEIDKLLTQIQELKNKV